MHTYVHICTYIHITCTHTYTLHAHIRTHYMYTYVHICTHTYTYVHSNIMLYYAKYTVIVWLVPLATVDTRLNAVNMSCIPPAHTCTHMYMHTIVN